MGNILGSVGGRIKEIRKERGFSQDQLGEKCGFHYSYIGGVERGERNVSLENLAKIAAALDVSMAQFFLFKEDSSEGKEVILQEVLSILRHQDIKNIRMAKNILNEIFTAFPEKP